MIDVLVAARRTRGLKQQTVAQAAGFSAYALSRYERGEARPTLAAVVAWARALDMELTLAPVSSTTTEASPAKPPPRPPSKPSPPVTPARAAELAAIERHLATRGATTLPPTGSPDLENYPPLTFDPRTRLYTRGPVRGNLSWGVRR